MSGIWNYIYIKIRGLDSLSVLPLAHIIQSKWVSLVWDKEFTTTWYDGVGVHVYLFDCHYTWLWHQGVDEALSLIHPPTYPLTWPHVSHEENLLPVASPYSCCPCEGLQSKMQGDIWFSGWRHKCELLFLLLQSRSHVQTTVCRKPLPLIRVVDNCEL